ncbi:hypothetical protein [Parvibaculum sp.]|uniref:hypothetical protein n=1 Tax=Parvibaculum sp. TaxID=2024848 RepID=UPI0025E4317F|nr:hypothetical protein [Parvibaculum sp.]
METPALFFLQVTPEPGGTGNHLLIIDTLASFAIDGAMAQEALDRVGLTTNKQVIPDDQNPPAHGKTW